MNTDCNQLYKGTTSLGSHGKGFYIKDTLVKYEFNTHILLYVVDIFLIPVEDLMQQLMIILLPSTLKMSIINQCGVIFSERGLKIH